MNDERTQADRDDRKDGPPTTLSAEHRGRLVKYAEARVDDLGEAIAAGLSRLDRASPADRELDRRSRSKLEDYLRGNFASELTKSIRALLRAIDAADAADREHHQDRRPIAIQPARHDRAVRVDLAALVQECSRVIAERPRDGSPPTIALSADVARAVADFALTLSRGIAEARSHGEAMRWRDFAADGPAVGGDGAADAWGSVVHAIHASAVRAGRATLETAIEADTSEDERALRSALRADPSLLTAVADGLRRASRGPVVGTLHELLEVRMFALGRGCQRAADRIERLLDLTPAPPTLPRAHVGPGTAQALGELLSRASARAAGAGGPELARAVRAGLAALRDGSELDPSQRRAIKAWRAASDQWPKMARWREAAGALLDTLDSERADSTRGDLEQAAGGDMAHWRETADALLEALDPERADATRGDLERAAAGDMTVAGATGVHLARRALNGGQEASDAFSSCRRRMATRAAQAARPDGMSTEEYAALGRLVGALREDLGGAVVDALRAVERPDDEAPPAARAGVHRRLAQVLAVDGVFERDARRALGRLSESTRPDAPVRDPSAP